MVIFTINELAMESKKPLPSSLAALQHYLAEIQLSEVASKLVTLWRQNKTDVLATFIEQELSKIQDDSSAKTVVIQELKNLQLLLQSEKTSRFKVTNQAGYILLVSSNAVNRLKICRILEPQGHHILIAKSQEQGIDAVVRQHAELVLLDADDEDDALSTLTAFKQHKTLKHLPILILSQTPNTEIAAEFIQQGATDVISPPYSGPLFSARIASALQVSHRREDDLSQGKAARRRHRQMHLIAERYLNSEVVNQMLDNPKQSELGGELREVSLLMCDMRGFTQITEKLAPQDVVALLNVYLGKMTEVVHQHGGIVNEFEGDSLLALFNAPIQLHEHTVAALTCAVNMQRAMSEVNARLTELNLPEISIGIGVVRGEVVVGNMGSERRMKYGVVGSPVNLSARLQSVANGGEIVALASQLSEGAGGARILRTGFVSPKGFSRDVEVAILVAP